MMTIQEVRKWRVDAARNYRMDSAAVIDDPDLREWAQGRAQLADEIEAMSDSELIEKIEFDRRLCDKMTSGVST